MLGTAITGLATARKSVMKLKEGEIYDLDQTINLSSRPNTTLVMNGATIRATTGFTGTNLVDVAGDCRIIGPGTFDGMNVPGPSNRLAAITAISKANPAIVTTATAHGFRQNEVVRLAGFGGMTQLNYSTNSNQDFVVLTPTATTFAVTNCSATNVQKFTGAETNAVFAFHGASRSRIENSRIDRYRWKGFSFASGLLNRIEGCHSRGGNIGHASHYLNSSSDSVIIDCTHSADLLGGVVGFGFKCTNCDRPVITNFSAVSPQAGGAILGCADFSITALTCE